jgi:hypothetical protein
MEDSKLFSFLRCLNDEQPPHPRHKQTDRQTDELPEAESSLTADSTSASPKTPRMFAQTVQKRNKSDKNYHWLFSQLQQLTRPSRVFLDKLLVSLQVEKFPAFMEVEGSLPCSQQPATGSYPEPDKTGPPSPTLFLSVQF